MSEKTEVIPNILSVFKHANHDYWAAEYRRKREDGKWSRGRPIHFPEIKTKEGAIIEAIARYDQGEFDKMFPAGTKRSRKKAEDAVRELIRWAGDNPDREGLKDTPRRVARAFEEFFAGYWQNPDEILATSFSETGGYDEMVALTDIPFESHCEHHMVPFVGVAHVAYIPDKTVVGISKLARLVDLYAKRLQIQEKMTTQIADTLQVVLNPLGVGVVIEATHMCMTSRGIKKKGVKMKTSRMLGAFKDDEKTRREFLSMIGGKSDTGS